MQACILAQLAWSTSCDFIQGHKRSSFHGDGKNIRWQVEAYKFLKWVLRTVMLSLPIHISLAKTYLFTKPKVKDWGSTLYPEYKGKNYEVTWQRHGSVEGSGRN